MIRVRFFFNKFKMVWHTFKWFLFLGLNVQEDVFSNNLLTKHIHLDLKGFKNHMQLAQGP